MPKLPVLRAKELIRILEKVGFIEKRQKGSHLIMVNEKSGKQIKKGTLAAILRQAEISINEIV